MTKFGTLENLIEWLKTKPADEEYSPSSHHNCLFAQWAKECSGVESFTTVPLYKGKAENWFGAAVGLSEIPQWERLYTYYKEPYTFGGALARAQNIPAEDWSLLD